MQQVGSANLVAQVVSQRERLIDVMNDHGLEQLMQSPTQKKNAFDLILTSLSGQFLEIRSPDKLSDQDVISETLKIHTPSPTPSKKKKKKKNYRNLEVRCFALKGNFWIYEERCIRIC